MFRSVAAVVGLALLAACSIQDRQFPGIIKSDQATVVPKDQTTAVLDERTKYFEEACAMGDPGACADLGVSYVMGIGAPRDPERGVALLSQSCELGAIKACNNLGRAYVDGIGVPRDYQKAAELFRMACDNRMAEACINLGVAYQQGEGIERNFARAATLFDEVCETGDGRACYNLAYAYSKGQGVTRDDQRAAALYERACLGGAAQGCGDLAAAYASGRGVDKDPEAALSLFHQACDKGDSGSCRLSHVDQFANRLVDHVTASEPLPLVSFRDAVAAMNQRVSSITGAPLFEEVQSSGDGHVRIVAADMWHDIPDNARTVYANSLFDQWATIAHGLEPHSLKIANADGDVVMERPHLF